jgi:hypothetical protein
MKRSRTTLHISLIMSLMVVATVTVFLIIYNNTHGSQQSSPGTFAPISYPTITKKKLEDAGGFFSNNLTENLIQLLKDNGILDKQTIDPLTCTNTYASNYTKFEVFHKYLDFAHFPFDKVDEWSAQSYQTYIPQYEVNDADLLSFIDRQKNKNQPVFDLAKCTTGNGLTLIGFTLNFDYSDGLVGDQRLLRIGYWKNNLLTHEVSLPKDTQLANCIKIPLIWTSNNIGYFECRNEGYFSIVQLDVNTGLNKSIMYCKSTWEAGIDSPPPTRECYLTI